MYICIYSIGHFSVSYSGQLRNDETDTLHLPVPMAALVVQMLDLFPSPISVYFETIRSIIFQ